MKTEASPMKVRKPALFLFTPIGKWETSRPSATPSFVNHAKKNGLYRVFLKAKGRFAVEWKVAFTQLLTDGTVKVQQEDLYDYQHSGASNTTSIMVKLYNNAILKLCQ